MRPLLSIKRSISPFLLVRSLKRPLHIHTKGEGFLGCLGQGDFFPRENLEPVKSLKGIDVRQVSSGWSHSAAVTRDGHLLVWGRPYDFKGSLRLSNLNRFAPIMVRAVNAFADSREVMTEPTIMPIIGQEVSTEGGPSMRVDVKVASVGCSSALTAVLTDAGHVYCMGQNRWGQCGVGSENPKHILSPTRSGGVLLKDEKVVRMALGFQHVLVLSESGKVFGWGKGERGQLGSTETDVRTAVRVPLPSKAVSVSCGFNHSVAVLESGEVYVWGKMQNPEVRDSSGPVPVYHDQHEPRRVKVASPEISAGDISDVVITEAVCGSYTTVLRSECGRLFIFGIMSDTRHILHTPREVNLPVSLPPSGQSSGLNDILVVTEKGEWASLSLLSTGVFLDVISFNESATGEEAAENEGLSSSSVKALCVGWKHMLALVG